jgi:hypothetical protein
MNPSIAIKNAGFPPLETANGIPSTDVQMEETASDVSSSAQITIEICVPANRTRPALSEEASNSVAKELRDALQPHLDGAGALTNSSKIPRFLAAVHKLKDPTLKLQSLAALEAVKDTKVLTEYVCYTTIIASYV